MKVGFRFIERMHGIYYLLSDQTEDRTISLVFRARAASLKSFLRKNRVAVEGELDLEGFATNRPAEGAVLLELEDRRLRYDFAFTADDGRPYTLRGEKDVQLIALVESLLSLPASVYDAEGKEVARANLRFDVRGDLVHFLRSWRLEGALW